MINKRIEEKNKQRKSIMEGSSKTIQDMVAINLEEIKFTPKFNNQILIESTSPNKKQFQTPSGLNESVSKSYCNQSISEDKENKSVSNCLVCFDKQPDSVILECGHGGKFFYLFFKNCFQINFYLKKDFVMTVLEECGEKMVAAIYVERYHIYYYLKKNINFFSIYKSFLIYNQ